MSEPLFSVGTWDTYRQAYTPQKGLSVPAFNITMRQLIVAVRELKQIGYSCHRFRDKDGSREDNDPYVLIERTDGRHWKEIRRDWNRITMTFDDFDKLERGAIFSDCRRYRYLLWRKWSDAPPLAFLMLNPSIADADTNDRTVARCEKRAREDGYGGLIVVNLFAFVATEPEDMKAALNAVGEHNDMAIRFAAEHAGRVVCAWGNHGRFRARGAVVLRMLKDVPLWALQITKEKQPNHPLYLKDGLPFIPLNEAARKVAA